jgi:hypothetical protein
MANTKTSLFAAANPLTGTELFYADDGSRDVKVTAAQIKTYATTGPVVVGNITVSSTDLKIGNTTSNLFANSVLLSIANTTGTANLKPTVLTIGATTLNATTLALGANVLLDVGHIQLGNGSANLFSNSILFKLANSSGTANLQPTQLVIGLATVNASAFVTGANVFLDTTKLAIGNTSSNLTVNSVIVSVGNTTGVANLTPTSLQLAANVLLDTTKLSIGNTTANLYANSILVAVSNSSGQANLQPTQLVIGSTTVNSTVISTGTINATTTVSSGNSTANLVANSIIVKLANTTGSANLQPTQLVIGTSTVNATMVNAAALTTASLVTGNATVYTTLSAATRSVTGSNSFTLGTSTAAANGYTYLFNGILIQWGSVLSNSSVGNITFPVAFPTAIFSYSATSNSTVAANLVSIIAANTTTMNVRSLSTAAASNSFWFAIGN